MSDMRSVFAETASALLDEDPLAAVVLAEISVDMFGKAAARHPDRVLNVGIREQLMVSVGGGLALAGMRPIVHTYAPFLVERAYEQVKLDLGHQDAHAVLVSIGASYDGARSGRTHQAPEDVILLDSVPGFSVVVPYLAGTSSHAVASALTSRPHRLLSLGVPLGELRRYGTPAEHAAFHGLDAAGIRRSVTGFLGWTA